MAFGGFIKKDQAVDILFGPFLDEDDGKTPETGLTLDVEVSKNGQALANKNDGTTPVHDATGTVDGYYNCELDGTDTNTLGVLTVVAHPVGTALPVRLDFQVVDSVNPLSADVIQIASNVNTVTELVDFLTNGWDTANNRVFADAEAIDGTAQRATDLAEITRYLFANAAVLTNIIADDSVLAQMLASGGDISDYDDTTDSQEAIADAIATTNTNIGTPADIDSGGATLSDNLKKMADDNGGANFDASKESLKAIRDHGDQSWLTGSGASADKSYTTTDWTRTVGDPDGGAGSDTDIVDGNLFSTGEINSGTIFLEVDGIFTIGDTETAQRVDFWGFYNGGATHSMTALAKNYADDTFEPIGTITLGTTVKKFSFDLAPGNTRAADDQVEIKFLHSGTGIPAHVFSIDKCTVNALTPASTLTAGEIVTELKGSTGDWTKGGTSTYAEIIQYIGAGVVGDKSLAAGTTTVKDIDNAASVYTVTVAATGTIYDVTIT